jgi:transcriptional regulator with XRE-family HTH domain
MARRAGGVEPQSGLGRAVRRLREEAKLGQQALAERSGISASWLAQIETGRHNPTWGTMRRIAAGLGVSMKKLSEVAEELESS